MRPSAFLRAFSMKIPARSLPSTVAPWPVVRSSFDGWLADELETLLVHHHLYSYSSARWLTSALKTAVATQKITMESILTSNNQSLLGYVNEQNSDREAIDEYLEDVVELLDSCNRLRERRETVQKYIDSLKTVLHCLEGKCDPNETVLGRARIALDSCELMERRCAMLDKCSSGLRKLAEKIIAQGGITCRTTTSKKPSSSLEYLNSSELQRVLSGSKAIAILTCGVFDIALSFKSKRGLPVIDQSGNVTSWSNSLNELHKELKEEIEKRRRSSNVVFSELRQAVDAAKNLRGLINSGENKARPGVELTTCVKDLRRACGELEEGIKPFEGRIDELYRVLISIRVALLGMLSQA